MKFSKLRKLIVYISHGDDGAEVHQAKIDLINKIAEYEYQNCYLVNQKPKGIVILKDELIHKIKLDLKVIKFDKWLNMSEPSIIMLGGLHWEIDLIFDSGEIHINGNKHPPQWKKFNNLISEIIGQAFW